MKIDIKKILLAGTAIVAVGAFAATSAHAAAIEIGNNNAVVNGVGIVDGDNIVDAVDDAGDQLDIDLDGTALTIGVDDTTIGIDATGAGDADASTIFITNQGAAAALLTIQGDGTDSILKDGSGFDLDIRIGEDSAAVAGAFATNVTIIDNVDGGGDDINFLLTGFDGNTLTFSGAIVDLGAGSVTLDGAADVVNINGAAAQDFTGFFDGGAAGMGTVNVLNTGGLVTFNDDIGGTNDLLAFTLAGADVQTDGVLNALTVTVGAGSTLTANGAVTADDLVFTGAGGSTVAFADAFTGDLTGSGGDDTLDVTGAANIGGAAAEFDFGAGNDDVTVTGASTFDGATFAGGTGTDTFTVTGANVAFGAGNDVTGFDAFNVTTANTLTFGGSVTGGTVTLGADGAILVINAADETVTSAVTGAAGVQTVTLTDGAFSGNTTLGAGADVFNFNGGTQTGTFNFGADADTLNAGGAVTIAGAMSGLETIVTGANTLTVEAAVTGLDDADNTGVNASGGVLNINDGGSLDGAIHGDNAGLVDFGADTNGGTFNLGGIVEDVMLTVTSGTLNTNGFALGGNSPIWDVTVATDARFNADDIVVSGGDLVNNGTLFLGSQDFGGAGDVSFTTATQTAGTGTFIFEVDSTDEFGQLLVDGGGAADITGSTIEMAVGLGNIADGDEFLIIDGTGTVVGGPGAVLTDVDDNSFLWNFQITRGDDAALAGGSDDSDMFAVATQAQSLASATTTGNNFNAVDVILNDLAGNADPDVINAQTNLNSAPTQEAFNEVAESLVTDVVTGGHVVASIEFAGSTLDMTDDRMAALRDGTEEQTGMAAGHAGQGLKWWAQVFGATADQDVRDNIDGYDADTWGLAVGLDTENISDNATIGVALSFGDTEVESRNANTTDTQVDSYQLTLYGDYDIDNATYVSGQAAYTWSDVDATRHDVGGAGGPDANSDFDADQFTLRGEVGRDYAYGDTTLTPSVMAHWTNYNADDFTETGAGGLNLTVDNESLNIFEIGVGVDASWDFQDAGGAHVVPTLSAGARYDLVGDEIEATTSFAAGGPAFGVSGADPAQGAIDLGAAITYYSTDNWDLTADYNFTYKSDYDSHSGFLRAGYHF